MLHNIYPELLEQYGDVVRIGPNELVFGNAAAVKDVHGANSMKVAKGPNYDVRLWASGRSLGEERNIQAHRLRRKIWDKGLNTKSILQYESRVLAIVEQFCAELELNVGEHHDSRRLPVCYKA
jgi:cytochrome P450